MPTDRTGGTMETTIVNKFDQIIIIIASLVDLVTVEKYRFKPGGDVKAGDREGEGQRLLGPAKTLSSESIRTID